MSCTTYSGRLRWIRNHIVCNNIANMRAGETDDKIYSRIPVTEEMLGLKCNYEIDFYPGDDTNTRWIVDLVEISSKREFSLVIEKV